MLTKTHLLIAAVACTGIFSSQAAKAEDATMENDGWYHLSSLSVNSALDVKFPSTEADSDRASFLDAGDLQPLNDGIEVKKNVLDKARQQYLDAVAHPKISTKDFDTEVKPEKSPSEADAKADYDAAKVAHEDAIDKSDTDAAEKAASDLSWSSVSHCRLLPWEWGTKAGIKGVSHEFGVRIAQPVARIYFPQKNHPPGAFQPFSSGSPTLGADFAQAYYVVGQWYSRDEKGNLTQNSKQMRLIVSPGIGMFTPVSNSPSGSGSQAVMANVGVFFEIELSKKIYYSAGGGYAWAWSTAAGGRSKQEGAPYIQIGQISWHF